MNNQNDTAGLSLISSSSKYVEGLHISIAGLSDSSFTGVLSQDGVLFSGVIRFTMLSSAADDIVKECGIGGMDELELRRVMLYGSPVERETDMDRLVDGTDGTPVSLLFDAQKLVIIAQNGSKAAADNVSVELDGIFSSGVQEQEGQDGPQEGLDGHTGQEGLDGHTGQEGLDGHTGQEGLDGQEGKRSLDQEAGSENKDSAADVDNDSSISESLETAAKEYTEAARDLPQTEPGPDRMDTALWLVPLVLALVFAAAFAAALMKIRSLRRRMAQPDQPANRTQTEQAGSGVPKSEAASLTVKEIHNIGKRPSQQDCYGCIRVPGGAFAVVADGMGGLSDGDKVSQKIVQTMLKDARNASAAQLSEKLLQMVAHANTEVNQMLGYKTYQSGSTLVAAVAERNSFRWVSIGDSRIYLYRAGGLLQINREHIYRNELLCKAVNRELPFSEAGNSEESRKVTSFIGMGEIKYIDQCLRPIRTLPGDKLMLCSDGIFNALSEPEMTAILSGCQDASSAAAEMERAVLSKNAQYQDNFSAVLFFYA